MAAKPGISVAMSEIARRLAELGIVLPKPAAPVANYVPTVRTSGMAPGAPPLLFVSGQLPLGPDGTLDDRHKGKLGPDSPIEAAREAAQRCAINILAQAQAALGDLDKVVRVVRLGGFFNVASSFDPLAQAMNGASDLMAEVFGERGRHARTTIGVAHLPMNALAEVDAVFEISS
jgi:enamine deaminase RidA (YjgF/YER057c/UK114 family)